MKPPPEPRSIDTVPALSFTRAARRGRHTLALLSTLCLFVVG